MPSLLSFASNGLPSTSRSPAILRPLATLLLVLSSVVSAAQRHAPVEPTIAAVTAGADTLDKVRSLYGNGAEANIHDVRTLCYYVEQGGAYLSVSSFEHSNRIRNITLTTLADIAPGCQAARIAGRHLTAVGGIGLGDSMDKVASLLGTPSDRGKMQMSNHKLTYTDYGVAGGQLTCQFEDGKLVLIAVEISSE